MSNRNRDRNRNRNVSQTAKKTEVLTVDVDKNNEVVLDLSPDVPTDENKIKVNENELDKQKEKILSRSKELETLLNGLDEDTINAELEKWGEKYGLSLKQIEKATNVIKTQMENADEPSVNLGISAIFQSLGLLPVSQLLKMQDTSYPLSDLIPLETVKNGTELYFYTDFTDADDLKAYVVPSGADYVNKLYNVETGLTTEEQYRTTVNLHKGLLIPMIALNDFTSVPSIFIAIYENVAFQVAHPMAKVLYKMRLQIIADPFNYLKALDWDTITPDLTINAKDGYDVLEQLKNFTESLSIVSRSNSPDRYKILGFTQNLEVSIDAKNTSMILPIALKNYLGVKLRSGAFNKEELDLMPPFRALNYEKTFAEYGSQSNVKGDVNKCRVFIVPKGASKIIQHFKGMRSQPLLTMHDVIHAYQRIGRSIDKLKPIYMIDINIANVE